MKKILSIVFMALLITSCSKDNENKDVNLAIQAKNGAIKYNVELADTQEKQEKGLMFRDKLAENSGMLFNFEQERRIVMWMKDTKIPLDMLFINTEGKIVSIYRNAKPMSEKYISSPYMVKAVLELNAGDAAKHGISVGDYVRHAIFPNGEKILKQILNPQCKKKRLAKPAPTAEK